MRRGAASIAANPVLIGAATSSWSSSPSSSPTTPTRACRSCPTYQLKAEVPERRQPRERQRGADRRLARRRGRRDHAVKRRDDGTIIARARRSSSRRTVKPLPMDSTLIIRPRSALGLKYVEITRGHVERGLRGRRHDPARATPRPTPVEFDEFFNMFDDETRAAAQSNLTGSATRFAGRGHDLNPAIERAPPAAARPHPGRAEPVRPARRGLRALLPRARAHRRDRRAGGRDAGRAVRQPRHDVRARCADVARPFIQDSITDGPPALDAAIERLPAPAAVPGQHRGAVPRAAARASSALRDRGAGPRRRARDRHADAARARRRSTAPRAAASRRSQRVRRGPAGAARRQAT